MAQVPSKRITSRGDAIDYTPSADVVAGDVVNFGGTPLVATQAIANGVLGSLATEGVFDVPKTTDTFTVGESVYWNPAGTPVADDTAVGAADNATGDLMGFAVANATNNASYVRVKLTAAERTATLAGSVGANDITGTDATLNITGIAGSDGAGGAVAVAGGAGDANEAGGAVSVTGGAGGTGTSNGAAASLIGGAAGAVGGTGGAVTVRSGAGDATNGTAGALVIDSGAGATKGAITIATNAASLTLGKMPRIPVAAVNAAGANQATAGALSEGVNIVALADNSAGVRLPSCVDGAQVIIISQTTDKTLKVYPPTGKQVNGAGANNAVTLAANGTAYLVSEGANAYYGGLIAGIMS